MEIFTEILVVPAPPHYSGTIWMGRIKKATLVACSKNIPILIVGDANGGQDNIFFAEFAKAVGAPHVYTERNGTEKKDKNTRGDMCATVRALKQNPDFKNIETVHIVTCWYHAPRAILEFKRAYKQELTNRKMKIRAVPVFARENILEGIVRIFHHHGEIRGCFGTLLNQPHKSAGRFRYQGKPDMKN